MSFKEVFFLPGLLCTGALFEYQISHLPEGFRGKGCELPALDSMELLAEELWKRISGNPILCGLSMGGIVCMEMFRQRPDRVAGLILMDTNALDESHPVSAERQRLLEIAQESSPGRVAGEILFEKQVHPSLIHDAHLKQRVIAMAEECGLSLFAHHAAALSARIDYSPILKGIRCPVLILTGEEDHICPEEKQRHMEDLIPHSERIRIPGAGHLSALEQPEAVSESLNSWFSRNILPF